MAIAAETLAQLRTAGLADVDPEIAALLGREARAAARHDRADRVRELHVAFGARGGRLASRRTSTPRGIRAGATTAAARSSTRSSSWRSTAPGSCSAPSTPTSSRTRARRPTWRCTTGCSTPATRSSSLRLDHGGHLTHGLKVNFSGRLYTIVHYGVSRETSLVEEDEVLALAREHRPKLIVCGGSRLSAHRRDARVPTDRGRGRTRC